MGIVFLDIESTGLDPDRHDIWEIAVITENDVERLWWPRPDLSTADPGALRLNGFYDRTMPGKLNRATGHTFEWQPPERVAERVALRLAGNHLVGVNPAFDAAFLDRWLRRHGQAPAWHYHLIDLGAMAYGWLNGLAAAARELSATVGEAALAGTAAWAAAEADLSLPWRSDDLSRLCGVDPPGEAERHTALGDARWVKRWHEALTGGAA